MPTYEFRCPRGHEFEKFYRSIGSAEAIADCPQCGLPGERQMSAAGFAFKGSGFYLTDYGKNAHREKAPASGDAKAPSAGGETAAPAAKSDASPAGSGDAAPSPESKKGAAKAAEAAPAAPPKKSSGE
jgi:putative FmdB family regulatory protein